MWDRAGDGHYETYVPAERLIRIYADLDDAGNLISDAWGARPFRRVRAPAPSATQLRSVTRLQPPGCPIQAFLRTIRRLAPVTMRDSVIVTSPAARCCAPAR
jgi:hypothetical protein